MSSTLLSFAPIRSALSDDCIRELLHFGLIKASEGRYHIHRDRKRNGYHRSSKTCELKNS